MEHERLKELAFALLDDIYGLDTEELGDIDPTALVERVARVHRGFAVEDEFAAIASWLGRCTAVSKLDGALRPKGSAYRVPDYLVVADYQGREVPFLVEVKSKDEETLEWSSSYFGSLRRFADLLGLPLLVAWKRQGLWVLTDTANFKKKVSAYTLTHDAALKNTLMSLLFGNVFIALDGDVRFVLRIRPLDPLAKGDKGMPPEGRFRGRIEEVGFWTHSGKLDNEAAKGVFWLFAAGACGSRLSRDGEYLVQEFLTDSGRVFNLSDVLVARLSVSQRGKSGIKWRAAIRNGLPRFGADLHGTLTRALALGVVHHVLDLVPAVMPEFLQDAKQ